MRKVLKFGGVIVLIYFALNLTCSWTELFLDRSISNQVNYINHQLASGVDSKLQQRYPEGFVFANSIFANSILELEGEDSLANMDYAKMIDRSIDRLLSEEAKTDFDETLKLPYGAFYNGWVNYTLKQYLSSDLINFSSQKSRFEREHERLSELMTKVQIDSVGILETYHGSVWPADNIVCMASLPNDKHLLKENWLSIILSDSQNELNLIHHDGFDKQIARGSSQSLLLYFLKDIDEQKSLEHNEKFNNHFVNNRLGAKLVKEYLHDEDGDIDSGPLLFGYGSVATIMNIKTQTVYGNKEKLSWNVLNLLGCPVNIFGKKYYLLKKEPMFDIFMLWTSVSLS